MQGSPIHDWGSGRGGPGTGEWLASPGLGACSKDHKAIRKDRTPPLHNATLRLSGPAVHVRDCRRMPSELGSVAG